MFMPGALSRRKQQEAAIVEDATAIFTGDIRLIDRVRLFVDAMVEPFGAPMRLESLDYSVRSNLCLKQKAVTDSVLYVMHRGHDSPAFTR